MQRLIITLALLLPLSLFGAIMNKNGIVTKMSQNSVKTTVETFFEAASQNGIKGFTIIDHKKNAQNRGMKEAKEAILIIFDELNICLDLVQYDPAVGLDLPLKVLIYKGEDNHVYIKYRDPKFLKNIYNVGNAKEALIMSRMLDKITENIIK